MKARARKRRPNALRGFIKAAWMLIEMLFLLPVWVVRAAAARARFRAALRVAGVPDKTVWALSDRYKLPLRDLGRLGRFPSQ